ncbi:MAG: flagellar export chaperone FliS [Clostridia bacterium]|nr:flagellar export chaperone FliS [Clostridia bacterium]
MQKSYQAYANNQILTASQDKLLLMLFDGMVRFTKNAAQACGEGKIEETNANLVKAQGILTQLMGNLNPDTGEIAGNLEQIYDYMHHQLVQANIKKDGSMIDEVHGMAMELREVWREAAMDARRGEAIHGRATAGE